MRRERSFGWIATVVVGACAPFGFACGGGSGGGNGAGDGGTSSGGGSGAVHCQGGGPGSDNCLCGTDVAPNDPNLVSQCSTSTLKSSVRACCKLHNSTNDCICHGYVCSFPSLNDQTDCSCEWGQTVLSMTTQSCTDMYCCEAPASSVLGGSCACGTTPCASGGTQVPQCGLSSPAPACPPGAEMVTSCM